MSMTREEAIDYIWDLSRSVGSEHCGSVWKLEELERETREALSALGVNS